MTKTGIERLDSLNNMLLLRNGNVPFDVVFLVGSVKDIDKVIQLEEQLVGLYVKENVLSEMPGVYFTDFKSAKSLLSEHKFKSINIDVTGFAPSFDYETFISDLGFDNLTDEMLDNVLSDELKAEIKLNKDNVVLETLMYHFNHHDDNKFHEDDFDWFLDKQKTQKELMDEDVNKIQVENKKEEHAKPLFEDNSKNTKEVPEKKEHSKPLFERKIPEKKNTSAKEIKNEHKEKQNVDDNILDDVYESKEVEEKKPVHGNGASIFASYRNAPVKKQEIKVSEEEVEEDALLKPEEVVEKKKTSYITKDKLSDEEREMNSMLLEELRKVYTEAIRFIEESCNSQYRIILNKMQDALKNNIYKTQFCTLYLEMSDDRRTPLYHKLYEVDMATINFQKKVVHQIINMGCPFCGHTWDEEITFLESGPHFVKCPNCFSERGFEKD